MAALRRKSLQFSPAIIVALFDNRVALLTKRSIPALEAKRPWSPSSGRSGEPPMNFGKQ
jgi:hypothetical protein